MVSDIEMKVSAVTQGSMSHSFHRLFMLSLSLPIALVDFVSLFTHSEDCIQKCNGCRNINVKYK